MRSVLEKDIEAKVMRWAKAHDLLPFKLNLVGNTGWPDRMWLFYHPKLCFIEFKRPGTTLKRNQPQRVAELRRRGYIVGVFDNVDDAIRFLETTLLSGGGGKADDQPSLRGAADGPRLGED